MKNKLLKTAALLVVLMLPAIINAQILLSGPQKIVIDAKRNRLLVSNGNTGDIVQIDSAGNQTFFIQGADFVDGIEIVGDTVYGVGSNRNIKGYHLDTKVEVMNVPFPGLPDNYLSSITSDSAGHLFISCPFLNEIYRMRISDQAFWVFAGNNGLNKPNGILLEKGKNRIVVIDDSPGTSLIHAISLSDSTVSTLMTNTMNRPDGIVRDKFGYYYIGGYYLAGVYIVDPGFNPPPQLFHPGNSIVYPTYDPSNHTLLVTHYNTNTWERIPLTTTEIGQMKRSEDFIFRSISPNPFQSQATIIFDLNRTLHAQLDIYDTVGALIYTLIDAKLEPGTHSKVWKGISKTGNQAPAGIYYFRLNADGVIQTQKGILVR